MRPTPEERERYYDLASEVLERLERTEHRTAVTGKLVGRAKSSRTTADDRHLWPQDRLPVLGHRHSSGWARQPF